MPLDNLSDAERLRLAQLMKAPLIPPAEPPRKRFTVQWPKWSARAAQHHITVHWRAWATGAATALACLILLAVAAQLMGRRAEPALKLQMRETQGHVQISWDAQAAPVRLATNAKLFITDGAERLFVTLDSWRLRRGTVSYARKSGRVELRMALTQPDGRLIEQDAVFFGAPLPDEDAPQLSAAAEPAAPATEPLVTDEVKAIEPAGMIEHRSRRKPLVQTGTRLPFTCAAGDVFRKTDAPAGWDTFTCKGKNVWSVAPVQTGEDRGTQRPDAGATTLTATASTT